jgi:hypothetical protein
MQASFVGSGSQRTIKHCLGREIRYCSWKILSTIDCGLWDCHFDSMVAFSSLLVALWVGSVGASLLPDLEFEWCGPNNQATRKEWFVLLNFPV